jgi:hypothetical protein
MVGTSPPCSCNTTQTSTYDNYDSGTASYTTSPDCWCNHYSYARIYVEPDIEIEITESVPPQWGIIRSIFYVMLILRHYVEAIARAPPFFIDRLAIV